MATLQYVVYLYLYLCSTSPAEFFLLLSERLSLVRVEFNISCYSTAQHSTVLYYTVLCFPVLYCTVLYTFPVASSFYSHLRCLSRLAASLCRDSHPILALEQNFRPAAAAAPTTANISILSHLSLVRGFGFSRANLCLCVCIFRSVHDAAVAVTVPVDECQPLVTALWRLSLSYASLLLSSPLCSRNDGYTALIRSAVRSCCPSLI